MRILAFSNKFNNKISSLCLFNLKKGAKMDNLNELGWIMVICSCVNIVAILGDFAAEYWHSGEIERTLGELLLYVVVICTGAIGNVILLLLTKVRNRFYYIGKMLNHISNRPVKIWRKR